MTLSKTLTEAAANEPDAIVAEVMRGVAAELRGTIHDGEPEGPNPYAGVADQHGLDAGKLSAWATTAGIEPHDLALVDVAEFRSVQP